MHKWIETEAGERNEKGNDKSSIGGLAYRPCFHASECPLALYKWRVLVQDQLSSSMPMIDWWYDAYQQDFDGRRSQGNQ